MRLGSIGESNRRPIGGDSLCIVVKTVNFACALLVSSLITPSQWRVIIHRPVLSRVLSQVLPLTRSLGLAQAENHRGRCPTHYLLFLQHRLELGNLSYRSQSFERIPSRSNPQESVFEVKDLISIKMACGKRISIDDMSIYYETHGSGPQVVLLIHGAVGK